MKPLVFLLEEEINSFLKKNPLQMDFSKGFAYSQDNNTVFHVFADIPKVNSSGIQLDCFFKYSEKEVLYEKIKQDLEINSNFQKKIPKTQQAIIIYFSKVENEKTVCKAFFYNSLELTECEVKFIPPQSELYSRNNGLIETDILKNKTVAIIGVGSGGSLIALELAKSGVGNFILFDYDRIELSNISRHICGINDLGRFKTFVVRDYILLKNPSARVVTHEININEDLEQFGEAIKDANLIICASDTKSSRFNVNQTSLSRNIISLYGRAITRAAGGDVLRVRPFIGPCLNCLFEAGLINKEEEISQMRQVRSELPAYVSDTEAKEMIQVGLSSDIIPIANMVTKLALVELSKGSESGISSLEDDLIADFYIWANRRERVYAQWPKMEYGFNKQSILRWYGAKLRKNENCIVCGNKTIGDENIFGENS